MEVKLIIELPEKVELCLDSICSSLCVIANATAGSVSAAPAPVEHPADVNPPATVEDVVPTAPEPEKEYTLTEVRQAVMSASRISPEVKAKVKGLVDLYAESVPKIPKDKYPEFMAKLQALSAESGGAK